MKRNNWIEDEKLRLQFIREFETFTDDELIKTHNNYVGFKLLNPFLNLRFQCFRDELKRRGFDMNGIATFNDDGRLKTYYHKAPIFILHINNRKVLVPYGGCLN